MGYYPAGKSLETPRDLLDPDQELGQLDHSRAAGHGGAPW
jgi:hypothetical protein